MSVKNNYDYNYNKDFGKRIKELREKLGLTLGELGEKVNLHESTIQRYESGGIKQLSIDKAKDFANALSVTPSYLMGWEEAPKQTPSTIAAHLPDGVKLTDEEQSQLDDYIQFILSRRGK